MTGQPGWFDLDRRYAALSAAGDPLERLGLAIDFELFRDELEAALARSDRAKGGRPPYDPVLYLSACVRLRRVSVGARWPGFPSAPGSCRSRTKFINAEPFPA